MGKYLKMADVFKVGVSDAGIKVRQNYIVEGVDDSFKPMEYAAHAINSHDELVAEVERLRGALHDAATSLETIHIRSFGEESLLDSKPQMRSFAGARAKVAREALAE